MSMLQIEVSADGNLAVTLEVESTKQSCMAFPFISNKAIWSIVLRS